MCSRAAGVGAVAGPATAPVQPLGRPRNARSDDRDVAFLTCSSSRSDRVRSCRLQIWHSMRLYHRDGRDCNLADRNGRRSRPIGDRGQWPCKCAWRIPLVTGTGRVEEPVAALPDARRSAGQAKSPRRSSNPDEDGPRRFAGRQLSTPVPHRSKYQKQVLIEFAVDLFYFIIVASSSTQSGSESHISDLKS